MSYYKILLVFTIFLSVYFNNLICGRVVSHKVAGNGCNITLPNGIPRNEPVYMVQHKNRYKLYKPSDKSNFFRVNSKLTLFCPGKRNFISSTFENTTELKCRSDYKFGIDEGVFNISEMNCTKRVENEYHVTNYSCGNYNGTIREIGFRINNNFLTIFKICYNDINKNTLYSTHFINGAAIPYNIKENKRRGFHATENMKTSMLDRLYTQQNQLEHFKRILGERQTYINSSSYLDRGHLTPDADFIFTTAQFSTYYYVNTAPEFKTINRGNWKRVENIARGLASKYKAEFLVYTGTYDVLQLPNEAGQNVRLYMDSEKQIPVPMWFWKIIKHNEMNSAIVIITLNNPFASADDITELCPNVCEDANLNSDSFRIIEKGYTFCCELKQFKKIVEFIPNNLDADRLLNCSDLQC